MESNRLENKSDHEGDFRVKPMGRVGRRRKQSITLAAHDRKAVDLLRNAEVAPIEIDDPYGIEAGDKIVVVRSLRDDPLARMHSCGIIDDAQFNSGRAWQRDYEAVEVSGARAIDTTREAVDGGRIPDSFTDRKMEAAKNLKEASKVLGALSEGILRDILAKRMMPKDVANSRGFVSKRQISHFSWIFQCSLDCLSEVYGFSSKKIK